MFCWEVEGRRTQSMPPLTDEIVRILRCLSCQSELQQGADGVVCTNCSRKYPRAKRVLRFVDTEHYAASFGFQWHAFRTTQLDHEESRRSEKDFQSRTGFHPEDLRGKLVLDVGCGMGRFAEVATRWGARVVGIDLSL